MTFIYEYDDLEIEVTIDSYETESLMNGPYEVGEFYYAESAYAEYLDYPGTFLTDDQIEDIKCEEEFQHKVNEVVKESFNPY